MTLKSLIIRWVLASAATIVLVIALAAWTNHPVQNHYYTPPSKDTIPGNELRDLDKELQKIEAARTRMERLKEKDWEKVQRDWEESIRKIDFEKIQQEASAAMQRLELEKTQHKIEESLSRIDFDKIQQQIDESMGKTGAADQEEIRESLQNAKAHIQDLLQNRNLKADLEKALQINEQDMQKQLSRMKKDMQKLQGEIRLDKFSFAKEMDKARMELDLAKEELKGYQEMIYSMEQAGLLNTQENYTIEYRKGNLFINDKKQPAEIASRYKQYFKKDKITIQKEDGDMHIQHNSGKH